MEDIKIDINDLELGELEEFEEASGLTIADLQEGRMTAKGATALVYVVKKRVDPEYTLAQARKVKITDLKFGDEGEQNPF